MARPERSRDAGSPDLTPIFKHARPWAPRPSGERTWLSLAGALCVGLSAFALPVSAAHAQGNVVVAPEGVYVHVSGMAFPSAVGAFRRTRIHQYDEAGRDVGVGYDYRTTDGRVAATVYVYPAPSLTSVGAADSAVAAARARSMKQEFEARKREIFGVTPDAGLVAEGDAVLRQGPASYAGRKAEFMLVRDFSGRRRRLASELYIFGYVGGKWIVKYRFSYPAEFDAAGLIAALMRDLRVTIPPEP